MRHQLELTPRGLELLRNAVEIAYADRDAPVFDRPEGEQEVRDLEKLLGMESPPKRGGE